MTERIVHAVKPGATRLINTSFNHSRAARKHRHRCLRLGDQKTNLLNNEDSIYLPPPPPHTHTHTSKHADTFAYAPHNKRNKEKRETRSVPPKQQLTTLCLSVCLSVCVCLQCQSTQNLPSVCLTVCLSVCVCLQCQSTRNLHCVCLSVYSVSPHSTYPVLRLAVRRFAGPAGRHAGTGAGQEPGGQRGRWSRPPLPLLRRRPQPRPRPAPPGIAPDGRLAGGGGVVRRVPLGRAEGHAAVAGCGGPLPAARHALLQGRPALVGPEAGVAAALVVVHQDRRQGSPLQDTLGHSARRGVIFGAEAGHFHGAWGQRGSMRSMRR